MATAALIERDISAGRIPGSAGIDAVAASVTVYATPVVLSVATAGTFAVKTLAGTSRTWDLPVGLFPVYITEITAITGGGVAFAIYQ